MAYNSAIPQPSNKLRNSQGDLLGNFDAINSFVNVDHVGFNLTNTGKHNTVTLPITTSSPSSPTFADTEMGIYNLLNAISTQEEIYVHLQQSSSGTRTQEIPSTASSVSRKAPTTTEAAGEGVQGWTYLPSGILVKWQHVTSNAGGGLETVSSVFVNSPNFATILAVIPSVYSASSSFYNSSVKFAGLVSGTTNYNLYFANGAGTGPADGQATVLLIGY